MVIVTVWEISCVWLAGDDVKVWLSGSPGSVNSAGRACLIAVAGWKWLSNSCLSACLG